MRTGSGVAAILGARRKQNTVLWKGRGTLPELYVGWFNRRGGRCWVLKGMLNFFEVENCAEFLCMCVSYRGTVKCTVNHHTRGRLKD